MRPYRYGQIISALLLNAYVFAYLQNKILYQGFFKRIPEPVLNCYGGPMSVFACPLGSLQQMLGVREIPWLVIGVFLLIGIVVGRMACAWVCPFGLWQDLLAKIPIGKSAGNKRWWSFAVIAGIAALIGIGLVTRARIPWLPVFVYGWLPFSLLILLVVGRGRVSVAPKLWLGGFLAALLLAVLVGRKFGADFGVVTVAVGMILLGLVGRRFAALLAAVAGLMLITLGPAFRIGAMPIALSGIVAAVSLAALVLVLDEKLKVTVPGNMLKFAFLLIVAGVVAYQTREPWFCKLCPQGTLEAGIPLVLWNPTGGLRELVGWLYYIKIALLLFVVIAAIAVKRPFCRFICPIGAIYSVFNKFSLLHLRVEKTCTNCNVCRRVCPMDIEVREGANQLECIRCLECKYRCKPASVQVKF